MERKRVAIVTHGLSANGIETLLVDVARFIDRERFDVTFIIAIDPGIPQLRETEVHALGMQVLRICDLDGMQKKKKYITSLYSVFKTGQFDVVHANMDLLNGVVLHTAKRAGIPVRICHAHTSGSPFAVRLSAKKVLQVCYRRFMRRLILRASTVRLGCSDAANRYMYGSAEATVLLNGIDLQRFVQAKETADRASDLREADIHLTTVGRIDVPKNPLFLCEIVRELAKLRQDFVLHWAGSGDMAGQVRDTVQQYGIEPYVQLLGVRTDIPQILCACDTFLLPSLFEGLGIVLIEAQACGLACFVSDVVPRQVDAGACRFLSLDRSAAEWAQEIDAYLRSGKRLTADPDKMAAFDIRGYVKKLESLYSE